MVKTLLSIHIDINRKGRSFYRKTKLLHFDLRLQRLFFFFLFLNSVHQWIIHYNSGLWIKKLNSINLKYLYRFPFLLGESFRHGVTTWMLEFHSGNVRFSKKKKIKSYATCLKRLCDFSQSLLQRANNNRLSHRDIRTHCQMQNDWRSVLLKLSTSAVPKSLLGVGLVTALQAGGSLVVTFPLILFKALLLLSKFMSWA